MIKILVTGANGQLGQCLQKIAPLYKDLEFTFKNSKELDITRLSEIVTAFIKDDFNYCINCAAYTDVEQAEKTPNIAFQVNSEGVKNLALLCENHETSLIHISTDYVFDGEKKEPYTIDDVPNPINEYGKSKLLGEKYIKEIMNSYCIIRTSWLYSNFGSNFAKTMLQLGKENEFVQVVDNQIGSPTYAMDLAETIIYLINSTSKFNGVYHFSNKGAISWYDFTIELFKKYDVQARVERIHSSKFKTFVMRPNYSVLSYTKLFNEFEIKQNFWKESLSKFFNN